MNVIILDIDGVLNKEGTVQRILHGGKMFTGLDTQLVKMFQDHVLAEISDVKVVLSSTWRLYPELKQAVEDCIPIYDVTSHLVRGSRGDEINAWLHGHDWKRFAIIDDDTEMLDWQLPHFFQTSWSSGLTRRIANKVVEHFNGKGVVHSGQGRWAKRGSGVEP